MHPNHRAYGNPLFGLILTCVSGIDQSNSILTVNRDHLELIGLPQCKPYRGYRTQCRYHQYGFPIRKPFPQDPF